MKHNNLKNTLKLGALLALGLVSRNAKAQDATPVDTYSETQQHCKFIRHKTQVVVNHRDTLQVYGIDTIYEDGKKKLVCDLGNKNHLVFDPYYYTYRLPPIRRGDTVADNMAQRHTQLMELYQKYQNQGLNDDLCDYIEQLIIANLAAMEQRATMNNCKQH